MKGLLPLSMVKPEIDGALQSAESQLKKVMESPQDLTALDDFFQTLAQLNGIAKMLQLKGVHRLIEELLLLGNQLQDAAIEPSKSDQLLTLLGHSILILDYYIDYIHRSQKSLAVLLLPAINDVRKWSGLPPLTDWFFLSGSHQYRPLHQFESKTATDHAYSSQDIIANGPRFRHMYQLGLVNLLKGEDHINNIKLMLRALERFGHYSVQHPIAQLWWIAQGVLEAFAVGDVNLEAGRKILLRKYDTEMRNLLSDPETFLDTTIETDLLQESLYIISISQDASQLIEDIKHAFDLKPATQSFLDTHIRQERGKMNGPNGSIISQVADGLKEDLLQIKNSIEMISKGVDMPEPHFREMYDNLSKLSSTLSMLNLPGASQKLNALLPVVEGWCQSTLPPTDQQGFYVELADMLMSVESDLTALASEYQTHSVGEPSKEKSSIPANLLEEARLLVMGESRVGLSMSKKAIATYVETDFRIEHIENVPNTLHNVSGALVFLEMPRAAAVVKACLSFVKQRMLDSTQGGIPQETFETMADAMTSVDYYLESLEEQRPMGDGLLDLAEESIQALGLAA